LEVLTEQKDRSFSLTALGERPGSGAFIKD